MAEAVRTEITTEALEALVDQIVEKKIRTLRPRLEPLLSFKEDFEKAMIERVTRLEGAVDVVNATLGMVQEDVRLLRQESREFRREISERILELHQKIDANMKWTIGTIVAMAGLIIAVIKLLP